MKKKNLNLLIFVVIVLMVTSCVTAGDGQTYNITYYVNDEVVEHSPSEYVSGQTLILQPFDVDGFLGWYDNSDLVGTPIDKIKKSSTGDLTFFAKIEDESNKSIYPIIYTLNGGALPIDAPSTYTVELGLDSLPIPVKSNYEFLGWTLNGEYVTSISPETTGKVSLIANWKKIEQVDNSLKDILSNMTNYSYTYKMIDVETSDVMTVVYDYDGVTLKINYEDDSFVLYITTIDNVGYIYMPDYDGYYLISENDEYYENYLYSYTFLDLTTINPNDFKVVNGSYQLSDSSKVHEVASLLIGEYESDTYTSLKLTTNDKYLTKIEASSDYIYENETYEYLYTVEFSNFGKVSITLPTISETSDVMTIKEVLDASDQETVYTKGFINGIVGNNVYIQDHTGGIYVYMGSQSLLGNNATLGQEVIVKGTKSTFSGLVEITNIETFEYTGSKVTLTATSLTDVSDSNLSKYACQLVTLSEASISSLPTSYNLENKDNSFKISDGKNTTTVFISKYISTSKKTEVFNLLKTLKVGDIVNITNGVISCHNSYQIVITENTIISIGKVQATKIQANYTTIKVKPDTPFTDILEKIVITLYYNNNETEIVTDYAMAHNYNGALGKYTVKVTYQGLYCEFTIVVSDEDSKPFEAPSDTKVLEDVIKDLGYDSESDTLYGVNRGLPSTGNPHVLVIPIEFTDYKAPTNMVKTLETAFFGTSVDTGWESLTSYYQKASYGKLNISGDVLPVFSTGKKSTYYDNIEDGDYEILKAALEYYDASIDYSKYDSDKDGFIDAIYLVYTCKINRTDDDSMWWAYTSEYYTDDYEYYDGVEADFYLLAGYDFLEETFASEYTPTYNLETFIHETGHLLGLDDYYDTDSSTGPDGGIGGGDMMDYNVGDHNAFSKAILGWVTPLIMGDDTATITLKSFGTSGDCLIIPKSWNGTYFDEYYIVDFYTPDGLNEKEAGASGLFSTKGIRIYHIDATLKDPADAWYIWDIYQYNNSSTDHKLISLVEADGENNIEKENAYSENSDLFQVNDTFKNVTWYDGTNANFELKVVSINDTEAVIEVVIK